MHLGIDLGGTKIETVVLDGNNRQIYKKRISSPRNSYERTCSAIVTLIREAEEALQTTCTVGIGIPGSISPQTGLIQNANSTWLIGKPLAEDLSKILNRPIPLANDADCFTLSEASDGSGADYKCVFGVILGTGVGGGLCINAKPVIGPNAITGEWGHNPLPFDLIEERFYELASCYCGRKHCIETYLSGPGFLAHFNHRNNLSLNSVEALLDFSDKELIEREKQQYTEKLASALAGVVNILDPDCIVLGGGLSNMSFLYESLPQAMQKFVFSETFTTPIKKARHGDSSGVRGAVWLGKNENI